MGHSKGSPEREVYSHKDYLKKVKHFNTQPNLTPTRTQGTKTKTTQSTYKGNNQDQSRVNDIETKSTIVRINKSTSWFSDR